MRTRLAFLIFLLTVVLSGCQGLGGNRREKHPPMLSSWNQQARGHLVSRNLPAGIPDATPARLRNALQDPNLGTADWEALMELCFEKGDRENNQVISAGVESFAFAACFAWKVMEKEGIDSPQARRASRLYQSSLVRVMEDGAEGKAFHSHGDWRYHENTPPFPVSPHGFPNHPWLFHQLSVPVPDTDASLTHYYTRAGTGLPVIFHPGANQVVDKTDVYHNLGHPFSATVLLLPNGKEDSAFCRIEVVNPRVYSSVKVNGKEVPLAADFSAPYEEMLDRDIASHLWILGFLQGDLESRHQGLYMVEPYQKGKIPVVFVHGLLSSPATWMETMNELDQVPGLREKYQFWIYMYPTSGSILLNGTDLRENLAKAVRDTDPSGEDVALRHMVLVGHSMGGLLARLQVTHSDEVLARGVSRVPIEQLQGSPPTLELAKRTFYFEPNPNIRHVVYIGTPHDGSPISIRPSGRVISWLAKVPTWQKSFRSEIIESNPGALYPAFSLQALPTSVDMLGTENPFLRLIRQVRRSEKIQVHSIAGDLDQVLEFRRGDGVVPIKSALDTPSDSKIVVPEKHTQLHHHPQTVAELKRILQLNLDEFKKENSKP
ncbi:MAG: alpha/beta hydrolase [Gemmataceae bacterium]|nr:alpha/beta hydrolase [Gemmataceae bacterium]